MASFVSNGRGVHVFQVTDQRICFLLPETEFRHALSAGLEKDPHIKFSPLRVTVGAGEFGSKISAQTVKLVAGDTIVLLKEDLSFVYCGLFPGREGNPLLSSFCVNDETV